MNLKYLTIDGDEYWLDENGAYHREDGPALIHKVYGKHWYKHNMLHRVDGPAIENECGSFWYANDQLHRADGPAVMHSTGVTKYYLFGKFITSDPKVFDRLIKLKAFW